MLLREDNLLHLSCLFEKLDFESWFLRCATFWNKVIQRVRFWKKKQFETCQKLKIVSVQEVTLWTLLLRRSDIFAFSLLFPKAWFWFKIFWLRQIKKLKNNKKSIFWLKALQCITFWTKTFLHFVIFCLQLFEMCRNSKIIAFKNHFFRNVTPYKGCFCIFDEHEFKLVLLRCVRFWRKFTNCVRFWIKNFKTFHSLKKVCLEKITLWIMLSRENDKFRTFLACPKRMILNQELYIASG